MSRLPDRVDASLAAFRTPYLQLAGLEINRRDFEQAERRT